MDSINQAFMLELSYRLTVAVNMADYKLESLPWMASWHKATLECAEQWSEHLHSTIVDMDAGNLLLIAGVNIIVDGLSPGYIKICGNPPVSKHDVFVYQQMLDAVHNIVFAPAFAEWRLSGFSVLGVQLALMDLKSDRRYTFSATPSPATNTPSSLLRSCGLSKRFFQEPNAADVRKNMKCLYKQRHRLVVMTDSFVIGGWLRVFMALMHPERNPSVLWVVPDLDFPERSYILAAGKAPLRPSVIYAKNVNDQALVTLVTRMRSDKEKNLPPADCGWEPCKKGLWTSGERSTLEDARRDLVELAAPLGQLEYVDGRKTNLPHCGELRLPKVWASPDAIILIAKKNDNQ